MILSRREFGKRATLTAVGMRLALIGAGVGMAGCNVFNDILNWVPVGEASLNSILTVLTSNGVAIAPAIQSVVSLIEAGFTALTAAVKEYQSTTPAPVGAVAKIQAAFNDIVDNFSTFLKSLSVSSGLVGIIVGLANVVFSTIAAFANQLPAPATAKFSASIREIHVGAVVQTVTPKLRTRRVFKKDFNSTLDAGAKASLVIPKSAYLPLTFWEHL
jgi:hypothetical protein